MKKLLVTGGSGFLGQVILQSAAENFESFGTWTSNKIDLLGVQFIPMNLLDENQIIHCFEQVRPDIVIHCAAFTNVDDCEFNRKDSYQANVNATETIARWACKKNVRLIYTSSDMVFDGRQKLYKETDFVDPINYYGQTKLEAEKKVLENYPEAVVARMALMYGESPTKSSFSSQLLKRFRNGETINIFNDQYRSPLWIQNAADALLELSSTETMGVIHLAGPDRVDRFTFSKYLAELHGIPLSQLNPLSVDAVQLKAQRPRDVSMDISLAKSILKTRLLGYQEGLKKAYRPI